MAGEKIYCYVDETGQDTEGELFIVSVIIPHNHDAVLQYLSEMETESGKGKFKWGRADPVKRVRYLRAIFTQKKYPLKIYYAKYVESKEYKHATILTIAKAIRSVSSNSDHRFIIYADGLSKKDQQYYGSQLHHLGIASKKVNVSYNDKMCMVIQ